MHNHAHPCAHDRLAHCPVCDVVYCAKCGREWGAHKSGWSPLPYYPWPYTSPTVAPPSPPYIVTCGTRTADVSSDAKAEPYRWTHDNGREASPHNHAAGYDDGLSGNEIMWDRVTESLDKSIRDNADVWKELAKR